MTQEQLKWTDKQWAEYLGCSIRTFKKARTIVQENYSINIAKNLTSNKYFIALDKRHDTPSGAIRYIPVFTTKKEFATIDEAVKFANETLIPSLQLNATLGLPTKILQTMHIQNQR